MPDTLTILKQKIKTALDIGSDVSISPEAARQQISIDLANAINAFVIGRQTVVTGTTSNGGTITGTGIVQ